MAAVWGSAELIAWAAKVIPAEPDSIYQTWRQKEGLWLGRGGNRLGLQRWPPWLSLEYAEAFLEQIPSFAFLGRPADPRITLHLSLERGGMELEVNMTLVLIPPPLYFQKADRTGVRSMDEEAGELCSL